MLQLVYPSGRFTGAVGRIGNPYGCATVVSSRRRYREYCGHKRHFHRRRLQGPRLIRAQLGREGWSAGHGGAVGVGKPN